jgi:exodeoxyribonuclease VII small subunit
MGFQSDLQKVQEITEKLSNQSTDLDESIKLYEEGIALVKKLEKQLTDAKRKVETVTGSVADGLYVTEVPDDGKSDTAK